MGSDTRPTPSIFAPVAGPAQLAAVVSTALLLAVAPLLVGSVHRWSMAVATVLSALAFAATLLFLKATGKVVRGARYALPLALLAVWTLLQTVPLPLALRGLIDRAGNDLLENAPPPPLKAFPLSLDPITTRVELLRAGLALLVFLVVLNLSLGRKGQSVLLLKAISLSAIVGVFIGIGHPLFNFDSIYGLYPAALSPTLIGPFINPNHTAQFFEIGAFAALACAFAEREQMSRLAWIGGATLCGAMSLATLSRGSLVGLAAGGLVLLIGFRPQKDSTTESNQPPSHRLWLLVPALGLVTFGLAVALGALPLWDELAHTGETNRSEKTAVWGDALRVLKAHPAGIGRGAFDRVYPAYRTLSAPVQQTFVENEFLQLFIDLGWLGALAFLAAVAFVAVAFFRRRLRDRVELSILAALAAFTAHNIFDFGVETMGLRIPFVALAAILIGRLLSGKRPASAGRSYGWVPLSIVFLTVPVGVHALASQVDFDAQLSAAKPGARRSLAVDAARAHPTDYFYPLTQAVEEPLRVDKSSPRLSALTRATRLCPNCANVHRATGNTLWLLNRRSQSLTEYRISMDLFPDLSGGVLDEIYKLGGDHNALASMKPSHPQVAITIAQTLVERGAAGQAPREAIEHAKSINADQSEVALLKVRLALNEHNLNAAAAELDRLEKAKKSSAVMYWRSVLESQRGDKRLALRLLNEGAESFPDDLQLARQRVRLATELQAWGDLERGIEGLKRALQAAGAPLTEAYIMSADGYVSRRNTPRAMRDYQTATSLDPANASAWYALATTAESGGFFTQALDAYRHVLSLIPNHKESLLAINRIETMRERAKFDSTVPAQGL